MPRRSLGPEPRSWLWQPNSQRRGEATHAPRPRVFGVKKLTYSDWKAAADETQRGFIEAAKVQHKAGQVLGVGILRSGLSVADVAAEIGMSEDGLYRVLNGTHHVSLTDLVRIAAACGLDVELEFPPRRDHER